MTIFRQAKQSMQNNLLCLSKEELKEKNGKGNSRKIFTSFFLLFLQNKAPAQTVG